MYQFTVDLQVTEAKERLDVGVLKGNKAKAFTPPRLAIKHNRRVDDLAKLGEELAHGFRRHASCKSTNEQLGRSLMFLSWYRSFGIDLDIKDTYEQT